MEKSLEGNQKELEKVNTRIQALESKISKEMHDKTSLQADKAALLAELKDEQVKGNALAKEVCLPSLLSYVQRLIIFRWRKQVKDTKLTTRNWKFLTSIRSSAICLFDSPSSLLNPL